MDENNGSDEERRGRIRSRLAIRTLLVRMTGGDDIDHDIHASSSGGAAAARVDEDKEEEEGDVARSVREFRTLLEAEGETAVDEAVKSESVPVLTDLLRRERGGGGGGVYGQNDYSRRDATIHLEAARALTYMAAVSDHAADEITLLEDGVALSRLVEMARGGSDDEYDNGGAAAALNPSPRPDAVRVQCALCLGNIAEGRTGLRDTCLERGAADAL